MEQQTSRRHSIVRLGLELIEQSIVLVFLELKLGAMELKRNVDSAKTGAALTAMGGFVLLFSLLGLMATAIAALALVLPVWLSALIVTSVLLFAGAGLLLTGLSKIKHFSLVPKETVDRVEKIGEKLKKHASMRDMEGVPAEVARPEAVKESTRDAARAARREAAKVREAVHKEAARARDLTYAKERSRVDEEEERKEKTG